MNDERRTETVYGVQNGDQRTRRVRRSKRWSAKRNGVRWSNDVRSARRCTKHDEYDRQTRQQMDLRWCEKIFHFPVDAPMFPMLQRKLKGVQLMYCERDWIANLTRTRHDTNSARTLECEQFAAFIGLRKEDYWLIQIQTNREERKRRLGKLLRNGLVKSDWCN